MYSGLPEKATPEGGSKMAQSSNTATGNVSSIRLFLVAVGTFCMMLCNGIINNSTTYFIKPVSEFLGVETTTFSLYFTIITICSAIMSLVVMPMVMRIGMRISAIIACIGVGAGFFMMSRVQALWMVYAGALLIGIFQAFVVVPTVSVINAWFTKNAGTVTGITMSATGFGGLLMGIIMPQVVANLDWRTGYMVIVGIWIALTLLICFLVGGEAPGAAAGSKAAAKKGAEKDDAYRKLLMTPSFWLVILSAVCISGVCMITQHMSVLLETHGMSLSMISVIIGSMSLALSFFKIVEGILADKIPLQIMTPVVLFIGAAGYLSLMANNTGLLFFGALGYGCAASSCTVLYPVILRRLYGKRLGTAVWGICWAAFMLGHAIWTPLIAKTYDVTGSYNVALISSAIIFVVAGIFLFIQISTKGMVEKD